jgi:hypothetical protein
MSCYAVLTHGTRMVDGNARQVEEGKVIIDQIERVQQEVKTIATMFGDGPDRS